MLNKIAYIIKAVQDIFLNQNYFTVYNMKFWDISYPDSNDPDVTLVDGPFLNKEKLSNWKYLESYRRAINFLQVGEQNIHQRITPQRRFAEY